MDFSHASKGFLHPEGRKLPDAMKRATTSIALTLLLAISSGAAQRPGVEFRPISCMRGGELPLLQVNVTGEGELRAYFRRLNTTDWCSVEGTNEGPLSRVVLPKFEPGDEIEYFFVLLDGRRVVARSPRIYRSSVNIDCESPFARHVNRLLLSCNDEPAGMPSSLGAGYSINSTPDPTEPTPFTPTGSSGQ